MAISTYTVPLTAALTASVTFTKPVANYGKGASITATDGGGAFAVNFSGADVDNGNGTMTASVVISGPVTGTLEVEIFDKP